MGEPPSSLRHVDVDGQRHVKPAFLAVAVQVRMRAALRLKAGREVLEPLAVLQAK